MLSAVKAAFVSQELVAADPTGKGAALSRLGKPALEKKQRKLSKRKSSSNAE